MTTKSKQIEQQIAELKAKLAAQQKKESAEVEAEMLRWVRRAGCQQEVIGFAKNLVNQKQAEAGYAGDGQ